jgi:hypothetical protein
VIDDRVLTIAISLGLGHKIISALVLFLGYLGELTLSIPWANLKNKPVKVYINNLYLLCVPKGESEVSKGTQPTLTNEPTVHQTSTHPRNSHSQTPLFLLHSTTRTKKPHEHRL